MTQPTFTNRDYAGFVDQIKAHIKTTRPDLFSDFTDASLGQLLIEMMSMVGDVVSYGQDAAVIETFLSTCRRYDSALYFAKSVGYVPRPYTAASCTLRSLEIPTALSIYGGTLAKGETIRGDNGLQYEVQENYDILPNQGVVRAIVREGRTHEETFTLSATRNQTIISGAPKVADASWEVWVGDTGTPTNEWTQVDSVLLETEPSQTFDVSFDADGRLIVRFGDGASGAIPSGVATLRYRTCNGREGNAPAKSIRGSMRVTVNTPIPSTGTVQFENYETQATTTGGTQFQESEYLGQTGVANGSTYDPSVTINGTLAHIPAVAGQVQVTITLPGAAGVIVLKDDGNGGWTVISNTSAHAYVAGAIVYSSGSVTATFGTDLAPGGSIIADYSFFASSDASQLTVVGAATGGDDRETLAELKNNIPVYVRTQDRLLTIDDYRKGLMRISGVSLAFVDNWASSYSGNVVRLYLWSKESAQLIAKNSAGGYIQVPYHRYAQAAAPTVLAAQAFVKPRTLLTVHHIIYRPEMLWVDLYLGPVSYDRRYAQATVREDIAKAVAAVAEASTGFALRIADIVDAVREVRGVLWFNPARIATGYRDVSSIPEGLGATNGSAAIAGTLTMPVVSPGSVTLTIEQGTYNIVVVDDGVGGWTVLNGSASINAGTIDYVTGAFSITFSTNLVSNQPFYATYRDVRNDYRAAQYVTTDDPVSPDLWPPPDAGNTPSTDGKPLSSVGLLNRYLPLQDIVIDQTISQSYFYDETYLYNNEITYSSTALNANDVRCINVRQLIFDLTPR